MWVKESSIFSFADDTSQSVEGSCLEEVCEKLQGEAEKVIDFMAANKLVINPTKTCCLLNESGRGTTGEITIAGKQIQGSEGSTLLGM